MSTTQTTRQTPIPPGKKSGRKPASRRRIPMALVLGTILLAVVVGGWLLLRSAPAEVDIQAAAGQVQTASSNDTGGNDQAAVAGTWTVDTSVGAFSVTESTRRLRRVPYR